MSDETARSAGKLVAREDYRAVYDPLSGFESICSRARQRRNIAFLAQHAPRRILEVGCGAMILARMDGAEAPAFEHWTIVEPEPDFVSAARQATAGDARFQIVPGYLEAVLPGLLQDQPQGFDAVLLSGLLHETAAPAALLAAAVQALRPGGHLLASVPNAASFHRLLAVEAGLIPAPQTLSPRDKALGHPVVFDAAGLTALLADAGLTGLTLDGYLFKPLTHAQMERVLAAESPALVEALVDGLIALGKRFPDQAAEICVTGRKPA
jgi:SAM-dependent methyltransferase